MIMNFSCTVLEDEHKRQNDDPVDKADLGGAHSRVIFDVHDFLQLTIAFLHLHARLLNMKVDSIEHSALLDDQVGDVTEQIAKVVHLAHDMVNFLFLQLCQSRVGLFDLFDDFLFLGPFLVVFLLI